MTAKPLMSLRAMTRRSRHVSPFAPTKKRYPCLNMESVFFKGEMRKRMERVSHRHLHLTVYGKLLRNDLSGNF